MTSRAATAATARTKVQRLEFLMLLHKGVLEELLIVRIILVFVYFSARLLGFSCLVLSLLVRFSHQRASFRHDLLQRGRLIPTINNKTMACQLCTNREAIPESAALHHVRNCKQRQICS